MAWAAGAGAAESPGCGPAVLEHGARGDGSTPLIQAAQDESLAVMEALLVGKADVNATHDSTGATALIVAAEQGSADAVRLLRLGRHAVLRALLDVRAAVQRGARQRGGRGGIGRGKWRNRDV